MPAYNAERVLGGALTGALNQSLQPLEILVVDDGSTDATAALGQAHPAPVRVIRQANGGVAAARNAAIRQAEGDFIAWLDSDDILLPRHLELAWQTWQQAAAGRADARWFVTGNAYRYTAAGLTKDTVLTKGFPAEAQQRRQILQNNFIAIFAFYPRRLHDELGPLDETLTRGEDRDLWTRAIFRGWRVRAQLEPQALYRMGAASMSADVAGMAQDERRILSKVRQDEDARLTAEESAYLDLRLASASPREMVEAANTAIRERRWEQAADQLGQAARLLPNDRAVAARARLARQPWARPVLTRQLRASDRRLKRAQ